MINLNLGNYQLTLQNNFLRQVSAPPELAIALTNIPNFPLNLERGFGSVEVPQPLASAMLAHRLTPLREPKALVCRSLSLTPRHPKQIDLSWIKIQDFVKGFCQVFGYTISLITNCNYVHEIDYLMLGEIHEDLEMRGVNTDLAWLLHNPKHKKVFSELDEKLAHYMINTSVLPYDTEFFSWDDASPETDKQDGLSTFDNACVLMSDLAKNLINYKTLLKKLCDNTASDPDILAIEKDVNELFKNNKANMQRLLNNKDLVDNNYLQSIKNQFVTVSSDDSFAQVLPKLYTLHELCMLQLEQNDDNTFNKRQESLIQPLYKRSIGIYLAGAWHFIKKNTDNTIEPILNDALKKIKAKYAIFYNGGVLEPQNEAVEKYETSTVYDKSVKLIYKENNQESLIGLPWVNVLQIILTTFRKIIALSEQIRAIPKCTHDDLNSAGSPEVVKEKEALAASNQKAIAEATHRKTYHYAIVNLFNFIYDHITEYQG